MTEEENEGKKRKERKEKIRRILDEFCNLMIDKNEDVQSIRVIAEMKNKSKVNFKRFRQGVK